MLITNALTGLILSSSITKADEPHTESSNVAVTVSSSCTMAGGSDGTSTSGNSVYSAAVNSSTTSEITGSRITVVCNDPNGYSLYAIGFSGNAYTTPTNTQMLGANDNNISTSTTTGTANSSWAMKLESVTGITPPTILNSFDAYHVIPQTYTQIAKYTSPTTSGNSSGSSVQTKYQVYISSGQAAGTYIGKVKYSIVHPNTAAAPSTKTIANATTMQEVGDCPASLPVGTTNTLTDTRDNQSYIVGKAADGNCWMLQNLKLGKTTTAQNPTITLTPANSDVGSNYTLNYNEKPADGKFHAYTVDGVTYQNNSTEYYCTDDYGCYYNWYTATAGTGTTYVTEGNVDNSICPAGWELPSDESGGQFQTLANSYNNSPTAMLVDNPTTTTENTTGKIPGFLLGGSYLTSGSYDVGSYGRYWSRTARNAQAAYRLTVYSSSVGSRDNNNKYLGHSVRCLVQE